MGVLVSISCQTGLPGPLPRHSMEGGRAEHVQIVKIPAFDDACQSAAAAAEDGADAYEEDDDADGLMPSHLASVVENL